MPREHNTNNDNSSNLPSVAIILTGKGSKSIGKTESSIAEQSYRNATVLQNTEESPPIFFNRMVKDHEIYGLMSAGDRFASKNSLQDIVNKLSENKFIGGVYADAHVEEGDIIQEFYFPPHDPQSFPNLIGVFPIFFKLEAIQEPLDENLEYLYGHNTLVKVSQSSVVFHIPELLFSLAPKEINIESDMNYLKNVS